MSFSPKPFHFLIPLITIATAVLGSLLTNPEIGKWYATIRKPAFTPPGSVIGMVWTIIFILSAISAILVWTYATKKAPLHWIAAAFLANAFLNVFWSYLFFRLHRLTLAGFEAILLELSILAIIVFVWPVSRLAALLLFPYAGWVAFAAYLTFTVASLN